MQCILSPSESPFWLITWLAKPSENGCFRIPFCDHRSPVAVDCKAVTLTNQSTGDCRVSICTAHKPKRPNELSSLNDWKVPHKSTSTWKPCLRFLSTQQMSQKKMEQPMAGRTSLRYSKSQIFRSQRDDAMCQKRRSLTPKFSKSPALDVNCTTR